MTDPEAPNEILAAAQEHKAHQDAALAAATRKGWPLAKIGLGVGIGSAAIAAAVLFANRDRGGK